MKNIGEKRIADYFQKNSIRYVYEQEARSKSLFFSHRIGTPDFYLTDYDVYVEFGDQWMQMTTGQERDTSEI